MKRLLFCLLFFCGVAHAQTFIDSDLGAANATLQEQKSPRVSGSLPAPWRDDSAWAPVDVKYERVTEGGRTFSRVNVVKLESGRAQVATDLPDVVPDKFYTLDLTLRGTPDLPLSVGLRQRTTPYQMMWDTAVPVTAQWHDVSFTFQPQANTQPIGFWFLISGEGRLDIGKVRLVAHSRDEILQQMQANYHGDTPKNLLRVTRFPLGLQSGWWANGEARIEADPQTAGPSGVASLHVVPEGHLELYSAPFAITQPWKKHVASFAVKAMGKVSCIVWADGKELARQELQPGDTWQRPQIAFTPELFTKAYALRFESDTPFWLDALKVEAGEAATPYDSQDQCEVSLSSGSLINVQFDDEPARVGYAVTGNIAGAIARGKIINAYGQEQMLSSMRVDLKSLPPGGPGKLDGNWNYTVFPNHPLGVYRIEAWIEDGNGNRISPYNEVVINRLHRPRYWMKDAPNSPFGSHLLSTTYNIQLAKAMGINWTRLHDAGLEYIGWKYLEPQKGQWQFRDTEINRYRRYGLKIMGELSTAPQWASYMKEAHDGYFDQFYQPRNLDDYANYVRVVTAHYKGIIDTYEVWNEPWNHPWWAIAYDATKDSDWNRYVTSEHPQADFAKLMQAAYTSAKATVPGITIVGVNSTTGQNGTDWTRGVIEGGGLDACDVISYHHYLGTDTAFAGDEVEKGFKEALGPVQEKVGRIPKPVWLSEGSSLYGNPRGSGFYHYTLPYPNDSLVTRSADRLCRFEVALLGQGVQKVFLYSMHAHPFFGQNVEWSVLVNNDGTMDPSGAALSALAWQLEDTHFARRLELRPGVFAYLFSGAGRSVAVLSPQGTTGAGAYVLPRITRASLSDLWGNPLAPGAKLGDTLAYVSMPGSVDALEVALK